MWDGLSRVTLYVRPLPSIGSGLPLYFQEGRVHGGLASYLYGLHGPESRWVL
jgi:hypothetical protein